MSVRNVRTEPLDAKNYVSWKLLRKALIIGNDLWGYVDGTIGIPPVVKLEENKKWQNFDQKAFEEITLSVTPSELGLIIDCKTSSEMWKQGMSCPVQVFYV